MVFGGALPPWWVCALLSVYVALSAWVAYLLCCAAGPDPSRTRAARRPTTETETPETPETETETETETPPTPPPGVARRVLRVLLRAARRALGERIFGAIRAAVSCVCAVCSTRNSLWQLMFLAIVLPGFWLFLHDVYPLISGVHRVACHGAVAATLWVFFLACAADPGVVDASTVRPFLSLFPPDGMLYAARPRICETCGVVRPPRSKHCRTCGLCVARLDHHCPWINQCVGALNTRWFIAFLLVTAVLAAYEAVLALAAARVLCKRGRLGELWIRSPGTGARTPLPWPYYLQYVLVEGGTIAPLGVFSALISVVLFLFGAFHVYLVARNTTTNETFKWSDYRRDVRAHFDAVRRRRAGRSDTTATAQDAAQDPALNGFPGDDGAPLYEIDSKGRPFARNRYNRGVLRNLAEALFPLRPRTYPLCMDANVAAAARHPPGAERGGSAPRRREEQEEEEEEEEEEDSAQARLSAPGGKSVAGRRRK